MQNVDIEKLIEEARYKERLEIAKKLLKTKLSLIEINKITNLEWDELVELNREINGYLPFIIDAEVAAGNIKDIDNSRLKNNYETVVESIIGLKPTFITMSSGIYNNFFGTNEKFLPLNEQYNFDISGYNQLDLYDGRRMVLDFEKHLRDNYNMDNSKITNMYKEIYDKNPDGWFRIFEGELDRQKHAAEYNEQIKQVSKQASSTSNDDFEFITGLDNNFSTGESIIPNHENDETRKKI